ncbi:hypothetical protein LP7551_04140 [Roseibium album]|nr:hypothetical protein LP7551_04140 [Roseibium album]
MSFHHSDAFNEIAGVQKERARQQDLEDFNNECSGNETGRMQRFLSRDAFKDARAAKTGKSRSSGKLSALDILLLNDLAYAHMHQAAIENNRAAQAKVTELQDSIVRVMSKLSKRSDGLLDQAVTLPDGRNAFMSKTGQAFTIDGDLVAPAITEGIDWSGRPEYEAYLSLVEDSAALEELNAKSEGHSLRLGEILNTLEDEDNPATKNKIQSLQMEQEEIVTHLDGIESQVQKIESRFDAQSHDNEQTSSQPLVAMKPEI